MRRLHGVVIDCPDPDSLATFYERLLDMVRVNDEDGWVVIGDSPDRPGLAFQKIDNYRARPGLAPRCRSRSTSTSGGRRHRAGGRSAVITRW